MLCIQSTNLNEFGSSKCCTLCAHSSILTQLSDFRMIVPENLWRRRYERTQRERKEMGTGDHVWGAKSSGSVDRLLGPGWCQRLRSLRKTNNRNVERRPWRRVWCVARAQRPAIGFWNRFVPRISATCAPTSTTVVCFREEGGYVAFVHPIPRAWLRPSL